MAQKVDKYLGYLKETICCEKPSNIAQSGHTDKGPKTLTKHFMLSVFKTWYSKLNGETTCGTISATSNLLYRRRRRRFPPRRWRHVTWWLGAASAWRVANTLSRRNKLRRFDFWPVLTLLMRKYLLNTMGPICVSTENLPRKYRYSDWLKKLSSQSA